MGRAERLTPDSIVAGAALLLFLPPRLTTVERERLADLLQSISARPPRLVGIISTFRVHLEDSGAAASEQSVVDLVHASGINARVAIFRPGLIVSPSSGATRWAERLGPLAPLAPLKLRTCFLEGSDLFSAIATECGPEPTADRAEPRQPGRSLGHRQRIYTLLGANTPWRTILERHQRRSLFGRGVAAVARGLAWLLVGSLVGWIIGGLARWVAAARPWVVHTIKPRSFRDLLALCHPGNIDHVRVVGYNNGVNHFGHRYAGRTIVTTGGCHRTAHARPSLLKADAGATIREARTYLGQHEEELFVVPNYSYVALGTSFFVPIHGSAVDYSTVADTTERVVLYDPDQDRIFRATRADAAFRDHVANPRSRAVLLRLYLKIKPKASYFVRRETVQNATAADLLAALRDRAAANVEIRQGYAASPRVTIAKYYTSAGDSAAPALEMPRDALGQLWDRLEENPVTSYLMHALSRHLAWHTELFLTPPEFEVFWQTHATVPLRKIQLRYIRRDGMPHSPFRDDDCVSADLFLFRPDKPAFDAYIRAHLPAIRTNPGKHSN